MCPFGSYGDHTTATCQQCEIQNNYYCTAFILFITITGSASSAILVTNATAYYLTLNEADVVIGRGVLNYTVIANETALGTLQGIFLTFSQLGPIQSIFKYDSGTREKNYQSSSLANLERQNNFIVIQEQIFIRNIIPDELFSGNTATFSLNLNTATFGMSVDGMVIFQDIDTSLFVTITRPGMYFKNYAFTP